MSCLFLLKVGLFVISGQRGADFLGIGGKYFRFLHLTGMRFQRHAVEARNNVKMQVKDESVRQRAR